MGGGYEIIRETQTSRIKVCIGGEVMEGLRGLSEAISWLRKRSQPDGDPESWGYALHLVLEAALKYRNLIKKLNKMSGHEVTLMFVCVTDGKSLREKLDI